MNLSPLTVDNNSLGDTMEQQGTPAQQIFFHRLHKMITNESHSGCIVWLPHGRGFAIPSKQAFTDTILPKYFGQSMFESFTRRLTRWGFVRQGGFYHNQFRRDMVFEDDYDDCDFHIKRQAPPPIVHGNISSISKGPLKKRLKQRFEQRLPSPPPICSSPSSDMGVLLPSNKSSDIHIMPELMRTVNKNKRKERDEHPLLSTKSAEGTELSRNLEEIMVARTLVSLELQVRKKPSHTHTPSVPIPYLVKPKAFSLGRAA